jgi:hypothetical protein
LRTKAAGKAIGSSLFRAAHLQKKRQQQKLHEVEEKENRDESVALNLKSKEPLDLQIAK